MGGICLLAGGLMGLINEPAGVHCMRYGRGSLALAAAAQQRGKVFRIGILFARNAGDPEG